MDQNMTELNLTIIQGTTFRQRLTVRDNGVAVPLTDRVFKGKVSAKPNGIPICDITFDMLDQINAPGDFEMIVTALQSKAFPMDPSVKGGFIIPTVFVHSITVTYNARPNDPESFAFGRVFVYPQAG